VAQSFEPEEPEIVLPPLLLEVEDLSEEQVSAVLPQGDENLLPTISVPLPDVEEISLSGLEFPLDALPDQPPIIGGAASRAKIGSDFFSEGMLGGGTMSHILGDISLYKIGSMPSFSMRFSHSILDGYGFREPGSGFKNREDIIEGTLTFDGETIRSETEANYTDVENGLQQNSDYDSVTHRFYYVGSNFVFSTPKIVKLYADAQFFGVNMILSADSPSNQPELNLTPGLGLGFAFPAVEFGIRGEYAFRTTFDDNDVYHSAGANAFIDAELPLAIDLSVSGGFSWDSLSAFSFPFEISLRGMVRDFFIYGISGGYRIQPAPYAEIWREYPFFDYSDPLEDTEAWFADGNVEFRFLDAFSIKAGAEFSAVSGELTPASTIDTTTGLYNVSVTDDVFHLYLSTEFAYNPGSIFSGSVGWRGQVLQDQDPLRYEHTLSLSLNLQSPNDRVGGALNASFPFDPGFIVPDVSASGFVKITNGVVLWMEALDVFAPLIDDGRIEWGDYEGPGFHFALKLRISL